MRLPLFPTPTIGIKKVIHIFYCMLNAFFGTSNIDINSMYTEAAKSGFSVLVTTSYLCFLLPQKHQGTFSTSSCITVPLLVPLLRYTREGEGEENPTSARFALHAVLLGRVVF